MMRSSEMSLVLEETVAARLRGSCSYESLSARLSGILVPIPAHCLSPRECGIQQHANADAFIDGKAPLDQSQGFDDRAKM